MLVFTAKINEAVFIDTNIVVRVLGVCGNQIKFGFVADKSIVIDREKVHYKKLDQLVANHRKNNNKI